MTIERHIFEKQKDFPQATGALTGLLYDMALAAKIIARETTRAGLVDILGATDSTNVYGERQQKLDMFADEVIFRMNDHTERLCAMASEEHEDILANSAALRQGQIRPALRPARRLVEHRRERLDWHDLRHPPQDHDGRAGRR